MGARRLGAQIAKVADLTIATAKPGQRHEVDLLIDGHRVDHGYQFLHHRIVLVILKHGQVRVVGRIGGIVRVGNDVLSVELARFGNDEAKLLVRDRQIGKFVFFGHDTSTNLQGRSCVPHTAN